MTKRLNKLGFGKKGDIRSSFFFVGLLSYLFPQRGFLSEAFTFFFFKIIHSALTFYKKRDIIIILV